MFTFDLMEDVVNKAYCFFRKKNFKLEHFY